MVAEVAASPVLMRDLLVRAAGALAAAGVADPRLDAELLMAQACGSTRAEVLAGFHSPAPHALRRFQEFVARRAAREPFAYIVGQREFYALDLIVNPAVLIPRPETETVVETALGLIAQKPQARILDLGTGSGCIALAIAANAPHARIVATDISPAALEVARANAMHLRLGGRVDFAGGDLFEAVKDARFDLIVSNPPYVEEGAAIAPEIKDFEPRIALYAGADGLGFYRRIAASVRAHLDAGGALILEVGVAQAEAVSGLFGAAGALEVRVLCDLAGAPRVVQARFA